MRTTAHISKYLRESKHSETLLVNQLSINRANNNQQIFKFGFGQSPFPVPVEISQALAESAYRKEYMSVQGHPPLREAIVNFHRIQEGKNWQSDNIIVGTGSKILLFCVMAAFEKAEVLVPAPSWVSYEPQAKLAGHKVSWLVTSFADKWKINAEQLTDFCIKRENPEIPLLLILNYPSNPTGQTYNSQQLFELAKVMREHNIIVIADEIYSLLNYKKSISEQGYSSIVDYYPEGCIVSSGLSKWCGAGGWRLGFIHIPNELEGLLNTVIGVASETYSCAPTPIQIAATKAYQEIELADNFLTKQTKLLDEVSQYCTEKLTEANINVHCAQGGFYLFPDFSNYTEKLSKIKIKTSEQLTSTLMNDIGVALLPGSAFGMDKSSLTTRLAFVDFDGEQINKAPMPSPQFEKIKLGIEQLCLWLSTL